MTPNSGSRKLAHNTDDLRERWNIRRERDDSERKPVSQSTGGTATGQQKTNDGKQGGGK